MFTFILKEKLFTIRALFCCLFIFVSSSHAQFPPTKCSQYFQYLTEGSRYFGKITLPISPGVTRVDVSLSQRGVVPTPNPSALSLYESQQTTVNNILSGLPISYRVEFPIPHDIPKITLIAVNGVTLCADSDYSPPSSQVKLMHLLQMQTSFSSITPHSVNGIDYISKPTNGVEESPSFSITPFFPNQNIDFNHLISFYNPKSKPPSTRRTVIPSSTPVYSERSGNPNEVCGRESYGSGVTPFVRGGQQLMRGQFPWLTAIYLKKGINLSFVCGGTLISSRTVLSAAHCFKERKIEPNKILLLLGSYNLATIDETGSQRRQVQNLILHPEYNPQAIADADIAVLHLQTSVSFNAYITPICLWNFGSDVSAIASTSAYVAGWGANENGEPVSLLPKKAEISILDDNSCRQSLKQFQTLISARTICAANKVGAGPCTGDSGGGLMISSGDRWYLRGIVSAGVTRYGQCNVDEHFYFCDIAKHLTWLQRYILQ